MSWDLIIETFLFELLQEFPFLLASILNGLLDAFQLRFGATIWD
jgi:hypothetical protein